jgi:hypothetical protein
MRNCSVSARAMAAAQLSSTASQDDNAGRPKSFVFDSLRAAASTVLSAAITASPHAVHFHQPLGRCRDHFAETPKAADELLGQRLHVTPRNGAEQHQLQKLVIGHRVGPTRKEARAQALAAREIMRAAIIPLNCRADGTSLWARG